MTALDKIVFLLLVSFIPSILSASFSEVDVKDVKMLLCGYYFISNV